MRYSNIPYSILYFFIIYFGDKEIWYIFASLKNNRGSSSVDCLPVGRVEHNPATAG